MTKRVGAFEWKANQGRCEPEAGESLPKITSELQD